MKGQLHAIVLALLAATCWGFENNCTRRISERSTYQIVVLKGIFSGGGSFLIALLRGERPDWLYFVALVIMAGGTALVVLDTLARHHTHIHQHLLTHTHDGSTHTHVIVHSHEHNHYTLSDSHGHHHSRQELEAALREAEK